MEKLFISKKYVSLIGEIYAISSQEGLKEVLINPGTLPNLPEGDPFGTIGLIKDYFEGRTKHFDMPFGFTASSFTMSVLKKTYEIPYGKTATYGQIALALGKPGASRAVGGALNRNPLPIIIPCHRVVASNSIGGFALGTDMKIRLLTLEGVNADTLR